MQASNQSYWWFCFPPGSEPLGCPVSPRFYGPCPMPTVSLGGGRAICSQPVASPVPLLCSTDWSLPPPQPCPAGSTVPLLTCSVQRFSFPEPASNPEPPTCRAGAALPSPGPGDSAFQPLTRPQAHSQSVFSPVPSTCQFRPLLLHVLSRSG